MSHKFIEYAIYEIEKLESTAKGRIITRDIRELSAELFLRIEDKTISNVLFICGHLLRNQSKKYSIVAFDFAYRMRKYYDGNTFEIFEEWLRLYCTDWDSVDDFCTHAFGELLRQNLKLFPKILNWTKAPEWWVRRAAAVIMIPIIKKNFPKTQFIYHGFMESIEIVKQLAPFDPVFSLHKNILNVKNGKNLVKFILENHRYVFETDVCVEGKHDVSETVNMIYDL